jgi:hypothetical protein
MLSRSDKILYHQIHPAKLAVDIAAGVVSTWLLWRHQLLLGMLIAWLPSIVVTAAMMRWMDFEQHHPHHHMERLSRLELRPCRMAFPGTLPIRLPTRTTPLAAMAKQLLLDMPLAPRWHAITLISQTDIVNL